MAEDRNLAAMRAYYERGEEQARLADGAGGRMVMDTARAVERVPELLGVGPHLLATAHAE